MALHSLGTKVKPVLRPEADEEASPCLDASWRAWLGFLLVESWESPSIPVPVFNLQPKVLP